MAKSFADSLNQNSISTLSVSATNAVATASVEPEEVYTLCDNGVYAIYNNYTDTTFSEVDNLRNISVNGSENQVAIAEEDKAQIIPFRIPRYWDGIDLMNMIIQIRYENTSNSNKGQIANVCNVRYSDKHILFHWLLDSNVTAKSGEVVFEIMASGFNEKNESYVWRTKPNGKFTVLKGLNYGGIVEPSNDWYTNFTASMTNFVREAKIYADEAKASAESVNSETIQNQIAEQVTADVNGNVQNILSAYYTKNSVDMLIQDLENTINAFDGLANLNITYNKTTGALTFLNGDEQIESFIIDSLGNLTVAYQVVDGQGKLIFKNGETEITSVLIGNIEPSAEWTDSLKADIQDTVDTKLNSISNDISSIQTRIVNIESLETNVETLNTHVNNIDTTLTETKNLANATDNSLKILKSDVDANTENVANMQTSIDSIITNIENLNKESNEYDVSYVDNVFTFYENDEVKQQFTITGGSGGSGGEATSSITIEKITDSTVIALLGDSINIEYNFTSLDNTGDITGSGTAVWKVGNTVVATTTALQGKNSFNITNHLKTGANTIRLTITDSFGGIASKVWSVTLVEFKLESSFDDTLFYTDNVTFRYTPYGDVSKNVIFILDGKEIGGSTILTSGRQTTKTIEKQSHGSHLLEVYMTAEINGKIITSDSIYKDIIWIEEGNATPIIGCNTTSINSRQYETNTITYVVYDLANNPAPITLYENDKLLSTLNVDRTAQIWSYKTTNIGEHTLKIVCGEVSKEITANISELSIDVTPVTDGLAFDFNPTGKSNNDVDWLNISETLQLELSDGFNTSIGGYQIDKDGDTYFCVKAGDRAVIPYKLFAQDARVNGKNLKITFKTTNVKDYDAVALSCMDENIGFQANAQNAILNSKGQTMTTPYCEDTLMELQFNILPSQDYKREMVFWTDAIPTRVELYESSDTFTHINPVGITIGSDNCDVHIYRMKAYEMSLTDEEILDNYIADAKNANEMLERYERNSIVDTNGDIDPDILAEKHPNLRVLKISVPYLADSKKTFITGCTIQQIYKGGRDVEDNWTAYDCSHRLQGTSSLGYRESSANLDIKLNNGIVMSDGTTASKYAMTENSIAENYFNIKVNVASSENANNAILADEYNTFNPYLREARKNNPKVRDTMEFHPCVIFLQETDTESAYCHSDGQYHLYACGDFGNSKKNNDSMGMVSDNHKEFIVEVLNNTDSQCRFLSDDLSNELWDGDGSFEFRYKNENCTEEEIQAGKDAWQRVLSWVVNATPEKFVAEFEDYFIKDSVLFFYLFTERHCMVDNRAKNTFWHTEDLIHWDICFDYDNDTADGNDNEGGLTLSYGYEDTDTIGSGHVFNAYDSKIWCYVRDYLASDLQEMYIKLESKLAWDSKRILQKYRDYQSVKPERLVIADMRRKYFRVYEENHNEAYLPMMHGDKHLQRKQFETYQDIYIASKYLGATCTSNAITIRGYTPASWIGVKPDGTFHITPYADMYIRVKYGNKFGTKTSTSTSTIIRGKRGQEYRVYCPINAMNDTEVYVYSASAIRSIGDISAFYAGYTDFGLATRLTDLIVGNGTDGYSNSNMTSIKMGNNILLEKLDLRNLPQLKQVVSLTGCANLTEFLAEGSGITGVEFASGGKIQTAHLPAISSFKAVNLKDLTDLQIENYDNLNTLVLENCSCLDAMDFINKSKNLQRIRLTGLDWTLENTDLLDQLAQLAGVNENGYDITTSVLQGKVHVPIMRQQKLNQYNALWDGLEITYDTMITQYTVTFVNDDENKTVLDVQYVDKGADAVDPITREVNPIATPTKESTVSTDYTFDSWSDSFTKIFTNRTIIAKYIETTRTYKIKYVSKGVTLQESTVEYGQSVEYSGDIPTYTAEESAFKYYLFSHWDSSGYVTGDKVINAVFEECEYYDGMFDGKELSDISLVELYALLHQEDSKNPFVVKDSIDFKLGVDYSFADIEEKVIIENDTVFDGTNKIDTGIKLMGEDMDYTLALDYTMSSDNSINATLMQCFQENGANGFRLMFTGNEPTLYWGSSANITPSGTNNREIIVLRHKKGESKLTVFTSNLSGNSINISTLSSNRNAIADSNLVLGCARADDGEYERYGKGTIHWCKLWYADLGDAQCQNLASWTHEVIPMAIAKMKETKEYYYSDGTNTRAKITFLAEQALSVQQVMSTNGLITGGWEQSTLKEWLNTRLYNAISPLWKALIKQVRVLANNGEVAEGKNELVYSDCYFYIPSIKEICTDLNSTTPYSGETTNTISYLNSDEMRKRMSTITANDASLSESDKYIEYFTRSANVGTSSYTNYYYSISTSGAVNRYSYASNAKNPLIMFSIGV